MKIKEIIIGGGKKMVDIIEIRIETLTPIWTGGVEGKCDSLHETGIIGSMRWWYEAIIRGLGGYACDLTGTEGCKLTGKEKSDDERKESMCPGYYLFGCEGWKRRFQLFIEEAPTTPLHFRTSNNMNKNWLKKIFGGQSQNIDKLKVFYGDIGLRFVLRKGYKEDVDYIKTQLIMLVMFISKYGGLGAKLQHGFGQIKLLEPKIANKDEVIKTGLKELSKRIQRREFYYKENRDIPYNLRNFVKIEYDLSASSLKDFISNDSHIGDFSKDHEDKYIPCALDLRYKGSGKFGMRRWLKETKKWSESDDPKQLGKIDQLLGPRSQWENNGKVIKIDESKRTASRLCFGMPYKLNNGKYRLRIFGFAPAGILKPDDLIDLCNEYMKDVFDKEYCLINSFLGRELITDRGEQ